jgi:ubiquinone biosynthesis protein Coq4
MEMDFMSHAVPTTDYEYFKRRRIQDHDIEHMVTGLNTSPVGETALIVFNNVAALNYFSPEFWQQISPGFLFLLSTNLMRASLHYPETVVPYFEGIALGHRMAMKQKQPFFFTEWERFLDWTIPAIREELNLTDAPPDNAWSETFIAEGIALAAE